jgi:hypothetical protein
MRASVAALTFGALDGVDEHDISARIARIDGTRIGSE